MTTNDKLFIDHVKAECKAYGVKCDLRKVKYVKLGANIKASGYFDESVPTLVCSMNRPDSLEILTHEFGHLTQWVEQIPIWVDSPDSLTFVDEWLSGKDVPDIKYHLGMCRDLELDNEKRAVKLIKKHGLSIDLDHYVRKANSYVQFYNYMFYSRRWCTPQNSPYGNKRLIESMPNKFNMQYKEIPKKYLQIFTEEGF